MSEDFDFLQMSLDDLPDEDVLGRPPAWPNGLFRFKVESVKEFETQPTEKTPDEHVRVSVGFTYTGDFDGFDGRRFRQGYTLPNTTDPENFWTHGQLIDLLRLVRACGLEGWNAKEFDNWEKARTALVELAQEAQELELVMHLSRNIPESEDKRTRYGDAEGYVNRVRKYWPPDTEEVMS